MTRCAECGQKEEFPKEHLDREGHAFRNLDLDDVMEKKNEKKGSSGCSGCLLILFSPLFLLVLFLKGILSLIIMAVVGILQLLVWLFKWGYILGKFLVVLDYKKSFSQKKFIRKDRFVHDFI